MKTFILPKAKEGLRELLNSLPKDIKYKVTVEEYVPRHSSEARAYYRGFVVPPIAIHVGVSPDEMHEIILKHLYGTKTVEFKGSKTEIAARRTRNMNAKDFANHILMSQALASELGVPIEQPEWEVEVL